MKSKLIATLALASLGSFFVAPVQAAYIVETRAGGKGFADFSLGGSTAPASTSTATSAAVGTTTGIGSIFGGNGVPADVYIYSYTPGADADNTTFATGAILGSKTNFPGQANISTGLTGGESGTYRVYLTVPESTNVSALGSDFTITQDGTSILLENVNLNNGGTGPDTDPGPAFVGGANNSWALLGTVELTAGNTYTVTQTAGDSSFVSQRGSAVMWELVTPAVVPEPGALLGLGIASLLVARRRRTN
jgi:hypothetical protein